MVKKKDETPAKKDDKPKGSLLDRMKSKATAAPAKPATKKKTRPVIQLEGEEAAIFDTFTSSDAILKVAKSGQEAAKGRITERLVAKYLRMCVENGYRPENPGVASTNSKCNLIAKHVSKFKRTVSGKGEPISVEDQLRELGFDDEVIETITTKIIKEKEHVGLKRFSDLQADDATPAQKAVADKIMELLQDNLSDEELGLVLETSVEATVDEGWQDTAVQLAVKAGEGDVDTAADALQKLYSVIAPQFVLSQMVFSGELSSALTHMAAAPPPVEKKVIKSANGKYVGVCEGDIATLYVVKPDGGDLIDGMKCAKKGTKKCTNAGHAEASIKKIFRDPEALAEALTEWA